MVIMLTHARVRKLLLTVYYRPPSGKVELFVNCLAEVLDELSDTNTKMDIVLIGDANIDLLTESNQKVLLYEFLNSYELEQIVDQPTRVGTKNSTLIDHIYIKAQYVNLSGCIDLSVSDHYLIYLVKKK